MAERFDDEATELDNEGSLGELSTSKYMKTEEFDPRGKVFTIAGFRQDEIKNSDGPAKKCNVLVFANEDRAFILKKTTVGELSDALGVDMSDKGGKKKCVGKKIEIYRGRTNYQGNTTACMRLRAPTQKTDEREPGSEG